MHYSTFFITLGLASIISAVPFRSLLDVNEPSNIDQPTATVTTTVLPTTAAPTSTTTDAVSICNNIPTPTSTADGVKAAVYALYNAIAVRNSAVANTSDAKSIQDTHDSAEVQVSHYFPPEAGLFKN
ncbi:hypothetical protein F5884DRAFT_810346 [Xylogone sp. PMI_703]|nr:hypothetical protein F5884DRAFT_810346 [Xylogone sp. PMI_703]